MLAKNCLKNVMTLFIGSLRVIVSKNQRNRGHGQKSISLILCQFEGLGK